MIKKRTNLEYSFPEKEGVDSLAILDFLSAVEKSGSEIHGIMILVHNKVIFEGYNAPYARDIPHIMHSFTKCLTNAAVGLAYSEGLLHLDDPIVKYLPEYAGEDGSFLNKATIRNLITMRSGQERSIGGNEWRPLKTSWLDAYFNVTFDKEPGSTYMYSSGNSYVLSAIVQRLTGKTAQEYIFEKISRKLEMRDFYWQSSPEGISSGGNGISMTVEEMAKIGLLYLNKGCWNGEQLLKPEWVDLSLGLKDAINPMEGEPEYNFHWWHEGEAWAAKGMFGQTCALIPSLDMVVAFTAADDTYAIWKLLYSKFIPNVKAREHLDEKNWESLRNKGLRMTLLDRCLSVENHMIPERKIYSFTLDGGVDGITAIELFLDNDRVLYAVTDHRGRHEVNAGFERWIAGSTSLTGAYLHHQYEMDCARISACAWWSDVNILMIAIRYPEMAFFDHISLTWSTDELQINRRVNMNSQDLTRPTIVLPL